MHDAIIISDLHLGARVCQTGKLLSFLRTLPPAARLILNGDVLEDSTVTLQPGHWEVLFRLAEIAQSIRLIWVRGNHDTPGAEHVARLIGAEFLPEYRFESGAAAILCIHGDGWDKFLVRHPWLIWAGDWLYFAAQCCSTKLARAVKHDSKMWLRCSEMVKAGAQAMARAKAYDTICCGHTHREETAPGYVNSGCWTEPLCGYVTVTDGVCELREF